MPGRPVPVLALEGRARLGRVPRAAASQAAIISASSSARLRAAAVDLRVQRLAAEHAGGGDMAPPPGERWVMTVSSG